MNLAVIPARAGSKGLKDKNIQPLCGKPLILWTLDAAARCPLIDKVVVTTDSEKIAKLVDNRADVIMRPKELGHDDVPLSQVVFHAWSEVDYKLSCERIITLQPTSPLRTDKHITEACARFQEQKADSLLSVVEENHSLWGVDDGAVEELYYPRVNRQWADVYYVGNGAIFITSRRTLIKHEDRIGDKVALYVMKHKDSLDIHTRQDLEMAEWIIKKRKNL